MHTAISVPPVTPGEGRVRSFGILSTFPPTSCGIATFSAALSAGLIATGASVDVVRVGPFFDHQSGHLQLVELARQGGGRQLQPVRDGFAVPFRPPLHVGVQDLLNLGIRRRLLRGREELLKLVRELERGTTS